MLSKYCEVQGIPFPNVKPSEEDRKNLKECYVFSDDSNFEAPMLVYFPLVNCSFKEFIAPGKLSFHQVYRYLCWAFPEIFSQFFFNSKCNPNVELGQPS